jgi:hypothetical protein
MSELTRPVDPWRKRKGPSATQSYLNYQVYQLIGRGLEKLIFPIFINFLLGENSPLHRLFCIEINVMTCAFRLSVA